MDPKLVAELAKELMGTNEHGAWCDRMEASQVVMQKPKYRQVFIHTIPTTDPEWIVEWWTDQLGVSDDCNTLLSLCLEHSGQVIYDAVKIQWNKEQDPTGGKYAPAAAL